MPFRSLFVAIVLGFGIVVSAFLINRQRPKVETEQPSAGHRKVRRVPLQPDLASAVTDKWPDYARAQVAMKQVCTQCHTTPLVNEVYARAEKVVEDTNAKVKEAQAIMDGLRKDGVLTGPPFSHPIDFVYFDLWRYDGRTAKHGAFMGDADFVQWHGNYPMPSKLVELRAAGDELRGQHGRGN